MLIGDAAGWSDPIVGQGLAVALRDARMVSEVLLGGDTWTPEAFGAYADERAERMRRIRIAAHVNTEINCTFTPQGGDRRVAVAAEFRHEPSHRRPVCGHIHRTRIAAGRGVHTRERGPHHQSRVRSVDR